ncbi:MAG: class I SAM-dependent methyltransferase [Gemmataceae bacterium]|nr:class I SAM-dependent methyltransferase [Gemmataceae bacterium]MCI0737580.1 class I SAM-dependent methyltransferase [Gemmataceae bacterium]
MTYFARATSLGLETTPAEVAWEECVCPLCGSPKYAPLVEAPDRTPGSSGLWFMVVQCQSCSLCYTNPRPSKDGMAQFYRNEYPPHQPCAKKPKAIRWWRRLPFWLHGAEHYRKALPPLGQLRLLDFGCGAGAFLARMLSQGWRVTGIDANETAVDNVRERLGVNAFVGSLPHPLLDDGSFDVVTMWQALEHTHEPLRVLRGAWKLLAPGGLLIVTVPNIDSLAFRLFGSVWNGLDLPRHLVHFAPGTLRLMLHSAGFRPSRVRMVRRGGWLRASARLAQRCLPGMHGWRRWLQGKVFSSIASWYAACTRQADCLLATATKP